MKFPTGDLNLGPYPLHSISTYICGVTIASRTCSGCLFPFYLHKFLAIQEDMVHEVYFFDNDMLHD